ncbi:hypothetical protein GGF43_005487 [Coemansia sp. RSA 2618]|nr:hypothetical protein GGF43_005487 [Coemansia sp. RSA 2618]
MSTIQKLYNIKEKVLKYEHTPYSRVLPLAQHPVLQFIPVFGNLVVFAQTCMVIRRINKTVRIPFHERLETWVSVIILLFVGMIPVLGLALTIYCTHCSDHLSIAFRHLKKQEKGQQQQKSSSEAADMEEATKEVLNGSSASLEMTSLARVDTTQSTSSTRSKKSIKDIIKRQGSLMSNKQDTDKPAQDKKTQDSQEEERPASKRQHSVFDRVSRMPWMDEVMATSPTELYRMSLSTNMQFTRPKTRYADIHDLATRNSKMPSSSLENLPSQLLASRMPGYSSDDLVLAVRQKRMTRSLYKDDSDVDTLASFDSGKMLKRPDYSNLSRGASISKSSSLVGLAPSPQLL